MAHPRTPQRAPSPDQERPRGDPWHAVGSLTAGVGLYGLLGWGLDRVLDTSFLVAIGIVFGALLGLYSVWKRFVSPAPAGPLDPFHLPTETEIRSTETRQEDR